MKSDFFNNMQVIAVCIFTSTAGVPALILDAQLFVSLLQE